MKIYVFGTGNYYKTVKDDIPCDDIICFLDNSEEKHGDELEGKIIIKPEEADFSKCDYVLVLILRYQTVITQLTELGVSQEKILLFSQFADIYRAKLIVYSKTEELRINDWLELHQKEKKVLLCCHELDRNGVSVVLMHLACLLMEMGYCVVEAGLLQGGLQEELREKGIDSIAPINYAYGSQQFLKFVSELDFVIAGTIGVADVVDQISSTGVPILWWIHESNDKDFRDFKLSFENNIHYYAGGSRVVECFKRYYPNHEIEELLYFIPDSYDKGRGRGGSGNELRIAIIGLINRRKGQDVFIRAIELLPENMKRNVRIDFIGKYLEPVVNLKEANRKYNINYIKELSQNELQIYYRKLDVLVCPSRDDPMPVVVTQAMQNSVTCIVSDEVGQSEYIVDGENGYVFESENSEELSEKLKICFSNVEKTRSMGIKSREIYERYFSVSSMKEKVMKIISQMQG